MTNQDYLAGRLLICWNPEKTEPQASANFVPVNVTERAVRLRDQAEKTGILPALRELGVHEATVPYDHRFASLSIDEMNLTVRSANGLKRAGIHTFRDLKEILEMEEGLSHIRNIGVESIREIKEQFFTECYVRLLPYEKAQYWQEVLEDYPDQQDAIRTYIENHLSDPSDRKELKKVIDALLRKGHSYSAIRRAMDCADMLEEEYG